MKVLFSKLIVFFMVSLTFLFGASTVSNAADESPSMPKDDSLKGVIAIKVDKSDAVISGQSKKIDDTNQEVVPFVEEDRVYVPVRFISEQFGAEVKWNDADKTINITSNNISISLAVGKKVIVVNNQEKEMDVAATVKNDRTFVPLRAISEALGMNVYYENGLVVLTSSDKKIDGTNDKNLIDTLNSRIGNSRGERPNGFMKANLMGEVSVINGSDITIKVMTMPQMNSGDKQKEKGAAAGSNTTEGTQQKMEPPQQPTPSYSGETKTITISEGISITTMERNDKERAEKTVSVADIQVGDIISVMYSDQDQNTISKIILQPKNQ